MIVRRPRRRLDRLVAVVGAWCLLLGLTACDANPSPDPSGCAAGAEGESGEPTFAAAQPAGDACVPPPCEDCAGIWGDPHLVTWDGRPYNVMAVGEFVVAEGGATSVQARFAPFGNSRVVSILSGVAADLGAGTTLEVTIDPETVGDPVARVDGEIVELDETPLPVGDALVVQADDGVITAWREDGLVLVIEGFGLRLELAMATADDVVGLLGSNDGAAANDVARADGEVIHDVGDHEAMYGPGGLADGWRVDDATTLFRYGPGETTETYTDRSFPDRTVTLDDLDPETRATAESTCRAAGVTDPGMLDDCTLDVGLTGDDSFAAAAAKMQERLRSTVSPTGSDSALDVDAGWAVRLDGLELGAAQPLVLGPLENPDAVYALATDPDTEASVLVALDIDSGEERWRVAGVNPRCGLAPVGDRVFVAGGSTTSLGRDGTATLVALDASSGAVLGATPIEGRNEVYCGPMVASGDTVLVPNELGAIDAWSVADTPARSWAVEDLAGLHGQLVVIDGLVVGTRSRTDEPSAREVFALDRASGAVVDAQSVRGRSAVGGIGVVAAGDRIVVSHAGDVDRPDVAGVVAALSVDASSDDALDLDWEVVAEPGAAFDERMNALSTDGAIVVGHAGADLVALDAASGEVAWRATPPGFRNTTSSAPIISGVVYDTVFGGAYLIARRPDADDTDDIEEFTAIEVVGVEAGAVMIGPSLDGRLFTLGAVGDVPLVASTPAP